LIGTPEPKGRTSGTKNEKETEGGKGNIQKKCTKVSSPGEAQKNEKATHDFLAKVRRMSTIKKERRKYQTARGG